VNCWRELVVRVREVLVRESLSGVSLFGFEVSN